MMAAAMVMIDATVRTLAAPHAAMLRCGHADVHLVSRRWAQREAPLAPVAQALSWRVDGRRVPVTIDVARSITVDGYRVRNSYIITWSCVTGVRNTHFVSLDYACAVDPGYPNDCGGTKEWSRLLDERGRRLDRDVPRQGGARLTRLYRRLGLLRTMEAGVTSTPVLE